MSQTRVLISPKPRALLPQQPLGLANLQATTLASAAAAAPFKPWIAPMPVRKLAAQSIEYRNLNTNLLAQDVYFLNDTGYTPDFRKPQRLVPFQNLNLTTLGTPASPPPPMTYLPAQVMRARQVRQPELQSGELQLLTAVVQAPFKPVQLPMPVRRKAAVQPELQSGEMQHLNAFTPPPGEWLWPSPVRARAVLQPQLASNVSTLSAPDATPDQFTFTDQTGVDRNTAIYSNAVTLTGFNATIAISVTGAQYSLNGADYTDAAGTASVGDTITLQVISSNTYATAVTGTFTAGGVSDDFTVTTEISPTPHKRRIALGYKRRTAFVSGRRRIH